MNFYIGNSVNEININDYNVELDDDLRSIINDLTKKINIDFSVLYDIDPYDDVVISNDHLTKLLDVIKNILSSNLLIEYSDYDTLKNTLTDLIKLINKAIFLRTNLISIGD